LNKPSEKSPARRILVRSPNYLGDQVMARPFYQALRQAFPHDSITLLSTENVAGLGYPELFDAHEIITAEERSARFGFLKTAKRLRGRFDLAISLPASVSSGLVLRLAGIRERIGFAEPASAWLFNRAYVWPGEESKLHKSALYLQLLPYLDKPIVPIKAVPLGAARPVENRIVLAPLASIELREWPYYEALVKELRRRYPTTRLHIVGTAHLRWSELIRSLGDSGIEDRLGKTTIAELIELCATSKLVIANDSGVGHVAGTLAQAPTLVIYGPGNPDYIRPLGPRVYDLRLETLPCSPCESARCLAPYGYKKCLVDLSTETLLAKVATLLPPATP